MNTLKSLISIVNPIVTPPHHTWITTSGVTRGIIVAGIAFVLALITVNNVLAQTTRTPTLSNDYNSGSNDDTITNARYIRVIVGDGSNFSVPIGSVVFTAVNGGRTITIRDVLKNRAGYANYDVAKGDFRNNSELGEGVWSITAQSFARSFDIPGLPMGEVSSALIITVDRTTPTATLTVAYSGEMEDATNINLNAGDKIIVTVTFSNDVSTFPTLQFKDGSDNLGSAISAVGDSNIKTYTFTVGSENVARGNLGYRLGDIADIAGNTYRPEEQALADTPVTVGFDLDVDENGVVTVLDGLMIIRYIGGTKEGRDLTAGLSDVGDPAPVAAKIARGIGGLLDVDENGAVTVLDGLMIIRHIGGTKEGEGLTAGLSDVDNPDTVATNIARLILP